MMLADFMKEEDPSMKAWARKVGGELRERARAARALLIETNGCRRCVRKLDGAKLRRKGGGAVLGARVVIEKQARSGWDGFL